MQSSCYLMGSLGSQGTCQGLRGIQGSPGFEACLPLDLSVVSPVSMGSHGFSRQHLQASTNSAAHECSVGSMINILSQSQLLLLATCSPCCPLQALSWTV